MHSSSKFGWNGLPSVSGGSNLPSVRGVGMLPICWVIQVSLGLLGELQP